MTYMLDTNILIRAIRRNGEHVRSKLLEHLGGDLCISSITYAELVYGARHSSDFDKNMQAVRGILAGIYILSFDANAAYEAGDIMAYLAQNGNLIGDRDTLIAAHARARKLILVTNNTREFARVPGLRLEDWTV